MKKRFFTVALIALFALVLTGCRRTEPLDAPENLAYEDGSLTWSEVDGAEGYRVILDDEATHDTETNSFMIPADLRGEMTAAVKALAADEEEDSDYTDTLAFTVIVTLPAPENVRQEGGQVLWDEVSLASGYVVEVDGAEQVVSDTAFTFSENDQEIRVRALGDETDHLLTGPFSAKLMLVEAEVLPALTNIEYTEGVITWDPVDKASAYEIYVKGDLETTITETTYTIPESIMEMEGVYIQIRAVSDIHEPSPLSFAIYPATTIITTEAELRDMSPMGSYTLQDDIALTAPWEPLDFSGRFDGAGHAITNIVIDGDNANSGFFGHLEDASVFNLTLVGEWDSTFTALEPNVGVLAGLAQGSAIENVHIDFTIDIESTNGVGKLGGLVGHLQYTNIADSSFTGTIDATHFATGGLVGRATSPEEASSVERSFVEAVITVTGGEQSYAGGFMGYMNVNKLTIRESYAHVDVTGPTYVGGFIAYLGSGFVEDSYAQGSLTATSSFLVHAGGFIGRLEGYNALVKNAISSVLVETDHENDYIRAGSFVGTTPAGTYNTMYEDCHYDNLVSTLDRIGNPPTGRGDGITGLAFDHTTPEGFDTAIWDFSGEKPALAWE